MFRKDIAGSPNTIPRILPLPMIHLQPGFTILWNYTVLKQALHKVGSMAMHPLGAYTSVTEFISTQRSIAQGALWRSAVILPRAGRRTRSGRATASSRGLLQKECLLLTGLVGTSEVVNGLAGNPSQRRIPIHQLLDIATITRNC